jgi:fused signal recognition particle receptor
MGCSGRECLRNRRGYGIVLTKRWDCKGGGVGAISSELGLPVRYVGVGEKAVDLLPFDPKEFVDSLFE